MFRASTIFPSCPPCSRRQIIVAFLQFQLPWRSLCFSCWYFCGAGGGSSAPTWRPHGRMGERQANSPQQVQRAVTAERSATWPRSWSQSNRTMVFCQRHENSSAHPRISMTVRTAMWATPVAQQQALGWAMAWASVKCGDRYDTAPFDMSCGKLHRRCILLRRKQKRHASCVLQ